jgi:serine/threonine protein kinase
MTIDADYSIPPYVSAGARRLLQRMLEKSSSKRATIKEIKASPWFLAKFPSSLRNIPTTPQAEKALRMREEERLRSNAKASANGDDEEEEKITGNFFHAYGGRSKDGKLASYEISAEVVEFLCERCEGLDREQVWETLQEGSNNR